MFIKKYVKSLIIRLNISVILLFVLISISNMNYLKNPIFSHLNFVKIMNLSSKLLPENTTKFGEVTVYNDKVYDNVIYKNKRNFVSNFSFNGVTCLTDGIIIKISKNNLNLFNVSIMDKNDYIYTYINLKSVDLNIYSYVENGTIIGESVFDDMQKIFYFELDITKNGEYYDFYKMAEN